MKWWPYLTLALGIITMLVITDMGYRERQAERLRHECEDQGGELVVNNTQIVCISRDVIFGESR